MKTEIIKLDADTKEKQNYLDFNYILEQGYIYNFLKSGRNSVGKSYSIKRYIIEEFVKNKNLFLLIRNNRLELTMNPQYLSEMIPYYEELTGYTNTRITVGKPHAGMISFVSDTLVGDVVCEVVGLQYNLTDPMLIKGGYLKNVKTVVYEEYVGGVISKQAEKKVVRQFIDILKTYFRDRDDYKVFMMANVYSKISLLEVEYANNPNAIMFRYIKKNSKDSPMSFSKETMDYLAGELEQEKINYREYHLVVTIKIKNNLFSLYSNVFSNNRLTKYVWGSSEIGNKPYKQVKRLLPRYLYHMFDDLEFRYDSFKTEVLVSEWYNEIKHSIRNMIEVDVDYVG